MLTHQAIFSFPLVFIRITTPVEISLSRSLSLFLSSLVVLLPIAPAVTFFSCLSLSRRALTRIRIFDQSDALLVSSSGRERERMPRILLFLRLTSHGCAPRNQIGTNERTRESRVPVRFIDKLIRAHVHGRSRRSFRFLLINYDNRKICFR